MYATLPHDPPAPATNSTTLAPLPQGPPAPAAASSFSWRQSADPGSGSREIDEGSYGGGGPSVVMLRLGGGGPTPGGGAGSSLRSVSSRSRMGVTALGPALLAVQEGLREMSSENLDSVMASTLEAVSPDPHPATATKE